MKQKIFLIIVLSLYISQNFAQSRDSILLEAFKCYKSKDYQKSFELYNELLISSTISDKDLFIWGKVLFFQKRYPEAIKVFNELSQKSDTSCKSHYWLAKSFCGIDSSKSHSIAKPYFESYIKKAQADTLKNIKELFNSYHYFGSYYFLGNVNLDSAIYFFNKMLNISPTNTEYLLKGYKGIMRVHLKKKEFDEAAFFAKKIREIDPKDMSLDFIEELYRNELASQDKLPTNLIEAVSHFEKYWSNKEKDAFKKMSENEAVSNAHFGAGLWIRNNWIYGKRAPELVCYFRDLGIFHPDDMSSIILKSLHRKLNCKDIDLTSQVEHYKSYWKPIFECDKEVRKVALKNYNNYHINDTISFSMKVPKSSGQRSAVIPMCPKTDWKFNPNSDLKVNGIVRDKYFLNDSSNVFFKILITKMNNDSILILMKKVKTGEIINLSLRGLEINK